VPVDSANPSVAKGTSYFATISPTVSSIFNFDIKPEDAGKTCSLVFLFPKQENLETSSFTFNGKGGMKVTSLTAPATEQTTYDTVPAAGHISNTISNVAPGNEYFVASMACPAGERIGVEVSSTDGLDLEYFQDYNPSPIGAYITVC
jgi:glucan endo-1,3-beta-D-glucosidase